MFTGGFVSRSVFRRPPPLSKFSSVDPFSNLPHSAANFQDVTTSETQKKISYNLRSLFKRISFLLEKKKNWYGFFFIKQIIYKSFTSFYMGTLGIRTISWSKTAIWNNMKSSKCTLETTTLTNVGSLSRNLKYKNDSRISILWHRIQLWLSEREASVVNSDAVWIHWSETRNHWWS